MGKFLFGVMFTLVALAAAIFFYARFGYVTLKANRRPGAIENYLAHRAFDAAVDRQAPKVENPIKPTEESLTQGMMIYTMHCAVCHGSPDKKDNPLGQSFYPPVPQFTRHAPDMPDWQAYWVLKNGVRYTGMPAWEQTLSDEEMWKVATFLGNWTNLPPAVKAKFQAAE